MVSNDSQIIVPRPYEYVSNILIGEIAGSFDREEIGQIRWFEGGSMVHVMCQEEVAYHCLFRISFKESMLSQRTGTTIN